MHTAILGHEEQTELKMDDDDDCQNIALSFFFMHEVYCAIQ